MLTKNRYSNDSIHSPLTCDSKSTLAHGCRFTTQLSPCRTIKTIFFWAWIYSQRASNRCIDNIRCHPWRRQPFCLAWLKETTLSVRRTVEIRCETIIPTQNMLACSLACPFTELFVSCMRNHLNTWARERERERKRERVQRIDILCVEKKKKKEKRIELSTHQYVAKRCVRKQWLRSSKQLLIVAKPNSSVRSGLAVETS